MATRTTILMLAGVFLFLIILVGIIVLSFVLPPSEPSPNVSLTPTQYPETTRLQPANINRLPTYPPEKGQGVDTSASIVKQSEEEITKLHQFLPYKRDYRLSTGIDVSIVIPPKDLQNNPWTLTVQIFNINYDTQPAQEDYEIMKQSFREAASDVFTWIRSHGVNPNIIFISWGDMPHAQEKATQWLEIN